MGYYVEKRVRKDGSVGWRLLHNSYPKGVRLQRHIPEGEAKDLGFRPNMTYEEAREKQRALNADAEVKRQETRKSAIKDRLKAEDDVETAYLPKEQVRRFERYLDKNFAHKRGYSRLLSHWRSSKKMLRELAIPTTDYWSNAGAAYAYAIKQTWSYSHFKKLLYTVNLWGSFVAGEAQRGYVPMPLPRGTDKSTIEDAYADSGKDKTSEPLTPELLAAAKEKLLPENYGWLFISLWFGLRPHEVDELRDRSKWRITKERGSDGKEHKCLDVYQSKLTYLAKDRRWKLIPILYPEQFKALEILMSGAFRRPLVKTIRRHVHSRVSAYGGRKHFEYMMIEEKGHSVESVADWMGHQNIETLWRRYRNRRRVRVR